MDILAVKKHRAALGRMNPGQTIQQGGFSAAVGAHDGGDLGRWQMKAQILRYNKLTVRQGDVVGGVSSGSAVNLMLSNNGCHCQSPPEW